jgi:hypothetical protein
MQSVGSGSTDSQVIAAASTGSVNGRAWPESSLIQIDADDPRCKPTGQPEMGHGPIARFASQGARTAVRGWAFGGVWPPMMASPANPRRAAKRFVCGTSTSGSQSKHVLRLLRSASTRLLMLPSAVSDPHASPRFTVSMSCTPLVRCSTRAGRDGRRPDLAGCKPASRQPGLRWHCLGSVKSYTPNYHRGEPHSLNPGHDRCLPNLSYPMYAGLAIAYLRGALLAGPWWPLATWPFALLAIRCVVSSLKSATS